MLLATVCVTLLSNCSDDQEIGMTLEGTWRGAMSVYTEYGNDRFQSVYSEVQFNGDPFRTTRGSGYWVDYYRESGWHRNYIAKSHPMESGEPNHPHSLSGRGCRLGNQRLPSEQ